MIDDEEDMDEGAVNEEVGDEVIDVTDDKVKNEDDEDKGGVMEEGIGDKEEVLDKKDRDEDIKVGDNEDRDERAMDEEVMEEVNLEVRIEVELLMVGVSVVLLMMELLVTCCAVEVVDTVAGTDKEVANADEVVVTVRAVGANEVVNTDEVGIVEVLADKVDI
uniref:Uncharacterized protein n=1 Tax=Amphimedon queenslandica TaxID=400682 RepID=A0A1X7SIL1_AMPQE